MRIRKDLSGEKFGRLLVLEYVGVAPNNSSQAIYRCRCDCGKEKNIWAANLKAGNSKSCGCHSGKGGSLDTLYKATKKHL